MLRVLFIVAILTVAPATSAREADAQSLYAAGKQAMRSKDYVGAAEALSRSATLRPSHSDTWFQLGVTLSRLQQWDGSLDAYQRVLKLDPRNAKAHNNLANVHFRRGEIEEAAAAYEKALTIDPDYVLAAFHLGWMLRQLSRPEEAEEAFGRCREIPASNPREQRAHLDCLFYIGTLRQRGGDYAAAAKIMEQVVRTNPGHSEARYYLGTAYRRLGRLDEARKQLGIHKEMLRRRAADIPIPELSDP